MPATTIRTELIRRVDEKSRRFAVVSVCTGTDGAAGRILSGERAVAGGSGADYHRHGPRALRQAIDGSRAGRS